MRPVLAAFEKGATKVSETLPYLKAELALTDEEASEMLPSGKKTVLSDRAHWARTYLSKAGCLESPKRNTHVITDFGRKVLQDHPDRIDNQVLKQVSSFAGWLESSGKRKGPADRPVADQDEHPAIETGSTPEELLLNSAELLNSVLAENLLQEVLALSPVRFERLILDLLRAMGFGGGKDQMYRETPASGDGGFDGIIDEDSLGLDAIYLQAKRYRPDNKVGREALQAFVGSLTGVAASKGVFVTTSSFSKHALSYVEKVQHRIVLIDGQDLANKMIQYEVGVRRRRTVHIRSIDEDYFADTE
ncbi:restriction endonuclease [Fluviibacterium sp. S390]|uniref:restriction endonuclease n=1 Tax=Fluviibacterium sp. S390 TaxID=3415139 RepID=UPI003C7A133E